MRSLLEPDDEHDKLLPDLLITKGVLARQWNVNEFLPWEVGKAPEVLGEFLSPISEKADQGEQRERYGKLGVQEYFLFDPDGTYGESTGGTSPGAGGSGPARGGDPSRPATRRTGTTTPSERR